MAAATASRAADETEESAAVARARARVDEAAAAVAEATLARRGLRRPLSLAAGADGVADEAQP